MSLAKRFKCLGWVMILNLLLSKLTVASAKAFYGETTIYEASWEFWVIILAMYLFFTGVIINNTENK